MEQKTIKDSLIFEGIGIHSGKPAVITFYPAPVNHGICFIRTDLPEKKTIQVSPENITPVERSSGLQDNGTRIRTIEHVLAALSGLGITNVSIEIQGEEPPILDGSSLPYAEKLKRNLIDQNKSPKFLELKEPCCVQTDETAIVALPATSLKIFCYIEFPGTAIGRQIAVFEEGKNDFLAEFAPARTFGFWQEVEELRRQGLALGGSLENSLVVGEKVYSTPLRLPDEPARHKLLDLMGDLYLLGQPLKAFIIAIKPSHSLSLKLVKKIAESIQDKN